MSTAQQQAMSTAIAQSGFRLVQHLNSLVTRQDLGALALLRRGLGQPPGEVPEIYAHVLPYLATSDTTTPAQRERAEDAALLVASLYALWHQSKAVPRSAQGMSLGAAFRQLANASDSGSIEQRFVALLKASRDRLPDHLRHAVSLLKAKEIPLDWARLFGDLCHWDQTDQRARHPVRRAWSRDYWERPRVAEEANAIGENGMDDGADGQDDD